MVIIVSIINSIRSYILEDEFKITYLNNRVNIVNYLSIGSIDSNKVIIKYNNGIVSVKGSNLVLSKLMNSEILISGDIYSIDFR